MNFGRNNNIGREAALVHFTLMAGYRLFSLFYPLFLAAQGLSLIQIGQAYLFIYLPIALAAPLAGFLTRIIHPALLAGAGCLGYGAYALGMVFFGGTGMALAWQAELGLAAALFFTGIRVLLIARGRGDDERNFELFYNAPYWAGALAPALGALVIWRFGFSAAFGISALVCALAALLCFGMVNYPWRSAKNKIPKPGFWFEWRRAVGAVFSKKIGAFIGLSFVVSLAEYLTHPFFVLFLKDNIGLSQNQVLQFMALSALVFSLFYFFVLRRRKLKNPSVEIRKGGVFAGAATLLFAPLMPWLNYGLVFMLEFGRAAGGFLAGAGRSAVLARELKKHPAQAGALDTVFSPLAVALGSFSGGYLIQWLGYQWLFFGAGAMVFLLSIWIGCVKNGNGVE
jgi:predicted MFS family arabinose efflux permease